MAAIKVFENIEKFDTYFLDAQIEQQEKFKLQSNTIDKLLNESKLGNLAVNSYIAPNTWYNQAKQYSIVYGALLSIKPELDYLHISFEKASEQIAALWYLADKNTWQLPTRYLAEVRSNKSQKS